MSEDIAYLIESKKTENPDYGYYRFTPNEEHAKKLAESMASDSKYRNVMLHEIKIIKTWKPVQRIEFEEDKKETVQD